MSSAARDHTINRILSTPVRQTPFPHIVVEEAFPPAFYAEIRRRLLPNSCYTPLIKTGRVGNTYRPERLSLFPQNVGNLDTTEDNKTFWTGLFKAYNDRRFVETWLKVFQEPIDERLMAGNVPAFVKTGAVNLTCEMYLMRDLTNYVLTPHTDSQPKVVSVLFYLPGDDSHPQLGTSLYAPKDKSFTNAGGPHLPAENFDLVTTLPYKPNTMVAFPKSSVCFHGVEPVRGVDQQRDLILFDIKFLESKAAK